MIVREARRVALVVALVFASAFSLLELYSWGFTVDDALITARVAVHIRNGGGYRFNAGGPVVDAVTPLGFAPLLAALSQGDVLVTMHFAKWLGAIAGVVSAAVVGVATARTEGSRARYAVLVPFALSAPLGAWCVSGMETGIVTLLATLVIVLPPFGAAAAAGLAGGLRPELVPWSVAVSAGVALAAGVRAPRAFAAVGLLAFGPSLAVALVRLAVFGSPAPLAVWAKPSDFAHGSFYAAAGLLWTGAPALIVGWDALRRIDARHRAVLVAAAVHVAALVLAGGDWMALFRLFVPVLPGLFVAGAAIAATSSLGATAARVGLASAVSAYLLFDKGSDARRVGPAREALIARARPVLAGSRAVAALDVGWVGAAYPGTVVDLAGVTDETIAKLPGGHTSKKVTPAMLEHRGVDTLVLLTEGPPANEHAESHPGEPRYSRLVEARLGASADLRLEPRAVLELGETGRRYIVLGMTNAP